MTLRTVLSFAVARLIKLHVAATAALESSSGQQSITMVVIVIDAATSLVDSQVEILTRKCWELLQPKPWQPPPFADYSSCCFAIIKMEETPKKFYVTDNCCIICCKTTGQIQKVSNSFVDNKSCEDVIKKLVNLVDFEQGIEYVCKNGHICRNCLERIRTIDRHIKTLNEMCASSMTQILSRSKRCFLSPASSPAKVHVSCVLDRNKTTCRLINVTTASAPTYTSRVTINMTDQNELPKQADARRSLQLESITIPELSRAAEQLPVPVRKSDHAYVKRQCSEKSVLVGVSDKTVVTALESMRDHSYVSAKGKIKNITR
jgi:hypothetical protein